MSFSLRGNGAGRGIGYALLPLLLGIILAYARGVNAETAQYYAYTFNFTLCGIGIFARDVILDSGATRSLSGLNNRHSIITGLKKLNEPVRIEGVNGPMFMNISVT